ncbi:GNAT family N-acetyltransferase [Novosphingobium sp. PC22D]|uniref:GNAT family N-acetyltransferase n=1 Tax=Novosphingobium sp. PC22D TaxID=1962403 RepID=UPI000BF16971|nr:GNAT family N-acetyltransferase [Novosphingobium sp. PC22D]PEQ12963.1 GNAT family N-acetyltransferase [Novosphingobium sp. PC22D]
MFIRTERLFLRPSWPEDVDELLDVLRDDEVARNLAVVALPSDAEAARRYLEQPRDPFLPHFFIYLRGAHGSRLVGGIGLGRHGNEVELGYWIAQAHRGRGYAAEAVRAVLAQARALGHHRIYASHFADNGASARVLQSVGFAPTGDIRCRFAAGRESEAPARIFVADLDHIPGEGMSAPHAAIA